MENNDFLENQEVNPLIKEIDLRSKESSQKVQDKIKNTIMPNIEGLGSYANKWLSGLQNDFFELLDNPESEIGAGNYTGWDRDDIKELYYVLYGEQIEGNNESEENEIESKEDPKEVINQQTSDIKKSEIKTEKIEASVDKWRADAERKFKHQQEIPTSGAYSIEDIQKSIDKAKEAGVDVTDLESELPELNKKMLRADAERKFKHQQEIPTSGAYSIEDIQKSIDKAKEAGVDVSDLESQIPELEGKMNK